MWANREPSSKSHGFHVAYASREIVERAFAGAGVDVASEETTATTGLHRKVAAYERLKPAVRNEIRAKLLAALTEELEPLFNALRRRLERRIARITMLALSGTSVQFPTIQGAVRFIKDYDEATSPTGVDRYELTVSYSDGSEVRGSFRDKQHGLDHLRLLCEADD